MRLAEQRCDEPSAACVLFIYVVKIQVNTVHLMSGDILTNIKHGILKYIHSSKYLFINFLAYIVVSCYAFGCVAVRRLIDSPGRRKTAMSL